MNFQLVFILGAGRTGTTLMQLLLDDHENIMVYPIEVTDALSKFLRATSGTGRASIREIRGSAFWKQMGFDAMGTSFTRGTGEVVDLSAVNRSIFLQKIDRNQEMIVDFESWWRFIASTFEQATVKDGSTADRTTKRVFVVQTNESAVELYLKHTPNAKYLMMIRNPYGSLNSYKLFYFRDPQRSKLYRTVKKSYSYPPASHMDKCKNIFIRISAYSGSEKLAVVRIEELQRNPRKEMTKVAAFLDVGYADSMEKVSVLGRESFGSSLNNTRAGSVLNKKSNKNWIITKEECLYINHNIPYTSHYPSASIPSGTMGSGPIDHLFIFKRWWRKHRGKGYMNSDSIKGFFSVFFFIIYILMLYASHRKWVKGQRIQIDKFHDSVVSREYL